MKPQPLGRVENHVQEICWACERHDLEKEVTGKRAEAIGQLRERLDQLDKEIQRLGVKTERGQATVRDQLESLRDDVTANRDVMEGNLDTLCTAAQDRFDDLQRSAEAALSALQDSVESFRAQLRGDRTRS